MIADRERIDSSPRTASVGLLFDFQNVARDECDTRHAFPRTLREETKYILKVAASVDSMSVAIFGLRSLYRVRLGFNALTLQILPEGTLQVRLRVYPRFGSAHTTRF